MSLLIILIQALFMLRLFLSEKSIYVLRGHLSGKDRQIIGRCQTKAAQENRSRAVNYRLSGNVKPACLLDESLFNKIIDNR